MKNKWEIEKLDDYEYKNNNENDFHPLSQLPCKVMAVLLHFFFLSAFAWMLVEGLHLYSMVVKVFGSEGSKHFYYYGIGWGKSALRSLFTTLWWITQMIYLAWLSLLSFYRFTVLLYSFYFTVPNLNHCPVSTSCQFFTVLFLKWPYWSNVVC